MHNKRAIAIATFKIANFEHEVKPGKCIFHNQKHPNTKNASLECSKLIDLLKQFPNQTTSPSNNPPPRQETPKSPPPIQAKKVQSPPQPSPPEPPTAPEINNALTTLTEFGETVNSTNDSVNSYFTITSKTVTL